MYLSILWFKFLFSYYWNWTYAVGFCTTGLNFYFFFGWGPEPGSIPHVVKLNCVFSLLRFPHTWNYLRLLVIYFDILCFIEINYDSLKHKLQHHHVLDLLHFYFQKCVRRISRWRDGFCFTGKVSCPATGLFWNYSNDRAIFAWCRFPNTAFASHANESCRNLLLVPCKVRLAYCRAGTKHAWESTVRFTGGRRNAHAHQGRCRLPDCKDNIKF